MNKYNQQGLVPKFVSHALWSYDTDSLDLQDHKKLLIKNILDHGTKKATDWLQTVYSVADIQNVIKSTPAGAWNKKSLGLWTLIYDTFPEHKTRFVG